jgi:predicted glycosyltransferase
MKIWIDVDNPPQVQYLVPFAAAFEARGIEVLLTARDYGETCDLLRACGVSAHVVGSRFGRGRLRKGFGSLSRASALAAHVVRSSGPLHARFSAMSALPDALLCASRSSALAAAALRIPSFVIADYEHASVGVYRLTGSTFLHPESVDTTTWLERGLRSSQLRPFRGIKEDISFAGIDLDAVPALDLPGDEVRVLVRPPAEDSHYFDGDSRRLALELLRMLATREGVRTVFAPRYPRQRADVEALDWCVEPVVLTEAVPFTSLLKAVDLVVCSGGTMLREAAYLGVPAYTILRSEIGGVDRWLESIDRVRVLADERDLERIAFRRRGPFAPLRTNPLLLDELAETVARRGAGRTHAPGTAPQPQV